MKNLVFNGWPHSSWYQGGFVPEGVVAKGHCKPGTKDVSTGALQVSAEGAAYLLATFPEAFTELAVKAAPVAKADKGA